MARAGRSKWESVEKAYAFLCERARAGDTFTLQQLMQGAEWTENTASTNISKKLKEVVTRRTGGRYGVDRRLLRLTLDEFKVAFGQKHRWFASYSNAFYPDVLVYDFFLPLAHESTLRAALDDLFYADTVKERLLTIGVRQVESAFPREGGETDDALVDRVTRFVGDVFVGYSVSHVNGRFRASGLVDRLTAMQKRQDGHPYLIDETTAVVRFILPCAATKLVDSAPTKPEMELIHVPDSADDQLGRIRWVFFHVFAEAVVEVMTQEVEIWLLESGRHSGLWVWERDSDSS